MPDSSRKILLASDHAGFALKGRSRRSSGRSGYDVEDLGPGSDASTDYADYAHPLAERGLERRGEAGGVTVRDRTRHGVRREPHPHVRAAVAWTPEVAALAREHNDANVLVLPARFVGTEEGKAILRAWLDTPFAGGRHARRIAKIERDADPNTSTEEKR